MAIIDNTYVYFHKDPETSEVVYVGQGTGFRAWTVHTHRSKEHQSYLDYLMDKGWLPCDWVYIYERGLTKLEALEVERKLIASHSPKFNKKFGEKLMKLSLADLLAAKARREAGEYYSKIASDLGVSTMTLHRALNGGSVRYKELLLNNGK